MFYIKYKSNVLLIWKDLFWFDVDGFDDDIEEDVNIEVDIGIVGIGGFCIDDNVVVNVDSDVDVSFGIDVIWGWDCNCDDIGDDVVFFGFNDDGKSGLDNVLIDEDVDGIVGVDDICELENIFDGVFECDNENIDDGVDGF